LLSDSVVLCVMELDKNLGTDWATLELILKHFRVLLIFLSVDIGQDHFIL